jgi:hypothetical protein
MTQPIRVGSEIDAFCTRCKLVLGHTILALVGKQIARVRCNTCQGEHRFHSEGPEERVGPSARKSRRAVEPSPAVRASLAIGGADLDRLLQGKDLSQPRKYRTSESFTKDEVLEHGSFGLGIVLATRGERMEVLFRSGVKTLALPHLGAPMHRGPRAVVDPATESDRES